MENNNNNANFVNANSRVQNTNGKNNFSVPTKQKRNSNFGKSFMLPFVSGVLGATLVVGVCFSVPSIKNTLIKSTSTSSSSSSTTSNIDYNNVNTNLVSLSNFSDTGVAVAQKVLPSVVGIKVEYSVSSIFSKSSSTATAEGSGVIISSDGYILTNNHVINSSSTSTSSYYEIGKANSISVYLYNDDTAYPATVIGTDAQTDLAVIKVNKTDLTAAELGDSDTVQVGEWCMAIGNPLGMKSSVTSGSISALNREITDSDGKTYTLVQTDAAINSGNSGGALVNSKGQVIGINTLKASGTGVEGLGFAIPINSTKSITSDLIQYKKVIRPYIGITGSDISQETIDANPSANLVIGAYVRSIEDYSPAEKSGLKIGDIITKVDGKTITTMDELNAEKNKHNIGDTITLTIIRDGSEKEVSVTLAEQP